MGKNMRNCRHFIIDMAGIGGASQTFYNTAIRDGKYLTPPHASAWQRSPIKILIFFRDVISLLARVFILLIDTATQEVPMKNI